jgi:hypothetical protein
MNKFFNALTTKDMRTENGMPTHSTSGSFIVDFFYEMGGYRNGRKPLGNLVGLFYAAFGENPNLAVKALFNLRDPRGGMGERKSGRILWNYFANSHPNIVRNLLPYIPALSRWDDLLYFLGTPVEEEAMGLLYHAILSGDKLAAKWTPRENKRGPAEFEKGQVAKYLMKIWKLSSRNYRDLLSKNTQVVETLMCGGNWEGIVFEHVPSAAMKKYRNAFKKHDADRFSAYLSAVEKGEKKINASVLNPNDIVHEYLGNLYSWMSRNVKALDRTLELQWKSLPDFVPDNLGFLPLCDLSGSMFGNSQIPGEVSIALGIYLSERNKSTFKNGFITFSAKPTFVYLTGETLHGKIHQMRKINMAENTDLGLAFKLILSKAREANLPQEEMPTHLLIISDMQFDSYQSVRNPDASAMEMIDELYGKYGYKRPQIVYWNVATAGGTPVKSAENGVSLVSGYSPSLMRNILSGEATPYHQVLAILNNGRYDFVNEVL